MAPRVSAINSSTRVDAAAFAAVPPSALVRKLDSITFDRLVAEQDPLGRGMGRITLDATGFISPAGVVGLAALCRALHRANTPARLSVDAGDLRTYFARIGLFRAVESIAVVDPPLESDLAHRFDARERSDDRLIELCRVETLSDLETLMPHVIDRLQLSFAFSRTAALEAADVIVEVLENGREHDGGAYFSMQAYAGGGFCEIACADAGPGVAATLARNIAHGRLSDRAAILRAIRPGVSGVVDSTRGTGLSHLLRVARAHGGLTQIRSGKARIRFRTDAGRQYRFAGPLIPGVQVALALPSAARDGAPMSVTRELGAQRGADGAERPRASPSRECRQPAEEGCRWQRLRVVSGLPVGTTPARPHWLPSNGSGAVRGPSSRRAPGHAWRWSTGIIAHGAA